ncbi:hypothetical protein SAMN04489842_3369 [Natronobacterium texcoconense]|uniref:Hsp20/alpha crystallin family protein n=2 Tax=Natronobacterium texcoconense TaxID=1095778 RepID=A0A1H1IAM4_NATTX|nr:hypothetical protein SAMN04489842_3369 [Natronobacterium texcoconense]
MQAVHDRSDGRLSIAVDAAPAALEDVSVEVGTRRVRISIDAGDDQHERTVVSPLPIGDDRSAVYHNGILTVTLETEAERLSRR